MKKGDFMEHEKKKVSITKEEIEMLLLKYNSALKTLENHLNILINDFEFKNRYMPVEHVKSRIKKFDSAIAKLSRKNYDITVENIEAHVHDMVGVRIVCSFLDDVYKIRELVKNSDFITVYEEKDYIKNPKETGYSSYHLLVYVPVYLSDGVELVKAEIQIRTMAMDFWASLDHKIQYKFEEKIPEDVIEEMHKCSVDINNLDSKMLSLNETVQSYLSDEE